MLPPDGCCSTAFAFAIGILTVWWRHVASAEETTIVSGDGVHASVRRVKCFGKDGEVASCLEAGQGEGGGEGWALVPRGKASAGCALAGLTLPAGMPGWPEPA